MTTLFETTLNASQQEILEALRWVVVAADTALIQKALAVHNIPRERNCIAKRLCELEEMGLVRRVGSNGRRTTWGRV